MVSRYVPGSSDEPDRGITAVTTPDSDTLGGVMPAMPLVVMVTVAYTAEGLPLTVPDKSTELILYCGGGYRSALAADVLQNMGYTNVWSMAGGWKAWKESGAPVES